LDREARRSVTALADLGQVRAYERERREVDGIARQLITAGEHLRI
jgi:hypothetical protein